MAKRPGTGERHSIAEGIVISLRPESQFWQIDIHRKGHRRSRESLGTIDRHEAKVRALRRAADLEVESSPLIAGYSFAQCLSEWIQIQPRHQQELDGVARILEDDVYPNRPCSEVTTIGVADALAQFSPGYANRLATIIRAALNRAEARNKLARAPKIERRYTPPIDPRYLRPDEWARLQEQMTESLANIVCFALETGLRKSNITKMKWSTVHLEAAQPFCYVEASRAKGRVSIRVALSPRAAAMIACQEGKHPVYVWTWNKGVRRDAKDTWKVKEHPDLPYATWPRKAFDNAKKAAGIEAFPWHALRKTWASWHTMSGLQPQVLQELGAWASRPWPSAWGIPTTGTL